MLTDIRLLLYEGRPSFRRTPFLREDALSERSSGGRPSYGRTPFQKEAQENALSERSTGGRFFCKKLRRTRFPKDVLFSKQVQRTRFPKDVLFSKQVQRTRFPKDVLFSKQVQRTRFFQRTPPEVKLYEGRASFASSRRKGVLRLSERPSGSFTSGGFLKEA